MEKITINSYEELENLSVKDIEENYYKKENYKNYTYYLVGTKGYYGICLFVIVNNRIIYRDMELHYQTYKTKKEIEQAMIEKMQNSIFNLDEFDKVESYKDYLNKIDFLNNYYDKMYDSISIYRTDKATAHQKEIINKNFLAKTISFCYFDNKEDLDRLEDLHNRVETAVIECLKDSEQKEQAILYELENHECFYTWDISDILFLGSYGITREEISAVFHKYLKEHKDLY